MCVVGGRYICVSQKRGRDIALRCPRPCAAGGKAGPTVVPRLNGAGTPQRGVPTSLNRNVAGQHRHASKHKRGSPIRHWVPSSAILPRSNVCPEALAGTVTYAWASEAPPGFGVPQSSSLLAL